MRDFLAFVSGTVDAQTATAFENRLRAIAEATASEQPTDAGGQWARATRVFRRDWMLKQYQQLALERPAVVQELPRCR